MKLTAVIAILAGLVSGDRNSIPIELRQDENANAYLMPIFMGSKRDERNLLIDT